MIKIRIKPAKKTKEEHLSFGYLQMLQSQFLILDVLNLHYDICELSKESLYFLSTHFE